MFEFIEVGGATIVAEERIFEGAIL